MYPVASSSSGNSSKPLPRLLAVDALRGCAALLVVVFHTPGPLPGPLVVLKPVAAMGWSGVGLFLVLSGFSIHFRWASSSLPHHEFAVGKFARRRFFRLYPTYVAAVAASVLVALGLGAHIDFHSAWTFSAGNAPLAVGIASQVLLIGANVIQVPYVGVAWSLGLEAQLYAMYAILVRRMWRIGVVRIVAWAFLITVAFRLGSQLATTSMPVGQFFRDGHVTELSRLLFAQIPARCFEWLLGALAAEMYFGRVRCARWMRSPTVAVVCLILGGLLFRHPLGAATVNGNEFMLTDVFLDQLLGVGFFVVLLAAIDREEWAASHAVAHPVVRSLGAVGIFSYSLYLLHPAALALSGDILRDHGMSGAAKTLGQWGFTLLAAWGFYLLVERHFTDGRVDRWTAERWSARGGRAPPEEA